MKQAGMTRSSINGQRFLVFDFVESSCNISVLKAQDGALVTLAVARNTNLGGSDVIEQLLDWMMEEFTKEMVSNVLADADRQLSVELAKRKLSMQTIQGEESRDVWEEKMEDLTIAWS
eukprot:Gregarina_sp_Poly_1__10880@NODE_848_length_5980_cov_131_325723_g613_i0_p6_GENE_NODE_848_length_5980_cov_131_325723_g613_i0NODE_848_length_5980_cov_131_325723_g613_i0_p6_ORF_typecomplete_len118_score19_61HSP70/PF00012_20/1_2e12Cas_Csa5/PF09702_10/0_0072_NODE_848_length_5980_cov_131_325723_g613_i050815434